MLNENGKRRLNDYNLTDKNAIFIENGFVHNLGKYPGENKSKIYDEFLNLVNKQDFYILEGHDEVIFDKDKTNIKPLVKYCLGNIEDSREMKKIKIGLIMLGFMIFMIIINFIFILMTKSVQNEILKSINLKSKIEKIEKNKVIKNDVKTPAPAPEPIKNQNYIGGSAHNDLYHK